jgi:hypothetical protein
MTVIGVVSGKKLLLVGCGLGRTANVFKCVKIRSKFCIEGCSHCKFPWVIEIK